MTNDQLVKLHTRHSEMKRELYDIVLETNQLRLELLSAVEKVRQIIHKDLSRPPSSPTSYYWDIFGEHWRSFELFSARIDIVYQHLSIPFDLDDNLLEQPKPNDNDMWEDIIDDMDEALYKLKMRKDSQKQLMLVIELIDSAERLVTLIIPRPQGKKGKRFMESLQSIRRSTQNVVEYLIELLEKHDISQIDLSIGQYPPPETTRIISRNDTNTDDDVVVDEIILNGYMWQDKLLRKADVIVTSREGA